MPSGDRTGPMGQGSMTGKGLGFCNGNNTPGSESGFEAPGRRRGRGFGPGWRAGVRRGLGLGNSWNQPFSEYGARRYWFPDKDEEIKMLKSQADALKNDQKEIERRIVKLEKED